MHQAKGLELRSIVVLACNHEMLPLESRVDTARDMDELNSNIEFERHLLYVAATRAREHLLITATNPASKLLVDMPVFRD